MTASELRHAREALGLTGDVLAVELGLTPAIIEALELGRMPIPRRVVTHVTWLVANHERAAALEASDLPDCAWVTAFEREPVPERLERQAAHLERLVRHAEGCPTCRAREAFIEERFPPMPPAPRYGWRGVLGLIVERIDRLPEWARPAATGASLFATYSLIMVLLRLPAIVRSPGSALLTALAGVLLSTAIGGVGGLLYGQYQRFQSRRAPRQASAKGTNGTGTSST